MSYAHSRKRRYDLSITRTKGSVLFSMRMDLLRSDETKIRILKQLRGSKELTLNALRNRIGSVNFVSVKRACLFLRRLSLIEMDSRRAGEREYIWVRLTEVGETLTRKL